MVNAITIPNIIATPFIIGYVIILILFAFLSKSDDYVSKRIKNVVIATLAMWIAGMLALGLASLAVLVIDKLF